MPKYPACSGAPLYGTPIQTYFTYPAVDETTGLSVELPTSEPTEAQVSYTIASGHLPTMTGTQLAYELAPIVWAYGQNSSGGSATVSYRVLLNSTSKYTGTSSSMTNTQYYLMNQYGAWGSSQPVVGDVLNIKLWASATGVYLNAKAMSVGVTRPKIKANQLFLAGMYNSGAVTLETGTENCPSFKSGTLSTQFYSYPNTVSTATASVGGASYGTPYALFENSTYGLLRQNYNDANGSAFIPVGASPTLWYPARLLSISLLPLNIKL